MIEELLTQYLQALQEGNYSDIMTLFTEDAVVKSPLYGEILASDFYKTLLRDTAQSKITVLNLFSKNNVGAAHFLYEWVLKGGTLTSFECVDIIQVFHGKIGKLTIIYDTYEVRQPFEKMVVH